MTTLLLRTMLGFYLKPPKHIVHVRELFKFRSSLLGRLPFCANGMTKVHEFSENSNRCPRQTYQLFHRVDKENVNREGKVSNFLFG